MGNERRLEADECPLAIAMQHPPTEGKGSSPRTKKQFVDIVILPVRLT